MTAPYHWLLDEDCRLTWCLCRLLMTLAACFRRIVLSAAGIVGRGCCQERPRGPARCTNGTPSDKVHQNSLDKRPPRIHTRPALPVKGVGEKRWHGNEAALV